MLGMNIEIIKNNMNLAQIERKFRQLEIKENYVRYFYNPMCSKIQGVKQHPYIEELHNDYDQDLKTYGMDPYVYVQQTKGATATRKLSPSKRNSQIQQQEQQDEEYQSQLLETPMVKQSARKLTRPATVKFSASLRPKTSNFRRTSTKRVVDENIYLGRPKNIIQQCQIPQQVFDKREQIVSNLPSGRLQHKEEPVYATFDEKQIIMSLYKIKIPTQILSILRTFMEKQRESAKKIVIQPSPPPDKRLSPRFGRRVSSLYGIQSSNRDLRNVSQLQISKDTETDMKDVLAVTEAQIIANQEIIHEDQNEHSINHRKMKNHSSLSNYKQYPQIHIEDDLMFNIKLTDLSDMENPFVIYEHKRIDEEGYIIFDNFDFNVLNPCKVFPWLGQPKDLERRTLKIEVTYMQELVLLRFIHLDKFYSVKYPQIMLEIANNMVQNQSLLKRQEREKGSGVVEGTDGSPSKTEENEGILIMKKVDSQSPQNLLQNEKVKKSIDNSIDTMDPHNMHADFYYALKPIRNPLYMLLEDLRNYRINLKNIDQIIKERGIEALPQSMKQLRIIIEYADCIIQAKDVTEYNILQDDNPRPRQQSIKESEEVVSRTKSLGRVIKCNAKNFNPVLLGQKLNSKVSMPQINRKSLNPQNATLIQQYGQNRSVQFYLRKELDQQVAQNRRIMTQKPASAAVNMRDNREIYSHLNDTALQTKPMAINYSHSAYQISRRAHRTTKNNHRGPRGSNFKEYFMDFEKGEIDVQENALNNSGDIPEFFQSVKSSQAFNALFGQQPDEHKEFMNFPYSRTQDTVGASMATPSCYFKDGLQRKTVKDLFYMRKDYTFVNSSNAQTRPSTSGRPGMRVPPMNLSKLNVQTSLTYFDEKEQIFGIQGVNNFI